MPLERSQIQNLVVVNTPEFRFPVIDHIGSVAQVEIDNVDAVNLTDLVVTLTSVDVFGDQLGRSEQHPLEIRILVVVLDFDDEQFPFRILGKNIYSVVLVELTFLVTLAFQ